jgi:hypothetical protein
MIPTSQRGLRGCSEAPRARPHTDGFIPRLRGRRRAGHWALLRASITKPTTSDAPLARLAKTIESVQPSAGYSMMPYITA